MSGAVASLDSVTKRFGGFTVLDGVSLAVRAGSVLALLGPNGAGKTTAISLLLGLRRADEGSVAVFGRDPRDPGARRDLGCTPQDAAFPATLKVREVIALVSAHFPRPTDTAALAERFGLGELVHRQTGGLSGGERRRLACALAFVGAPPLVVLDEPTTGLDAEARGRAWEACRAHARAGGSILLTTHHLEEAEALADAIVVIDRGRVVTAGALAAVRARAGGARISFRTEPLPPDLAGAVVENGRVTIHSREAAATVRALVRAGARLDDLDVRPLPLDEVLERLPRDIA